MCGATKRRYICTDTSQVLNSSNASSISIPIFTSTQMDLGPRNALYTSNSLINANNRKGKTRHTQVNIQTPVHQKLLLI